MTLGQFWGDTLPWLLKAAGLGAVVAVDGQSALHAIASQPLAVGTLAGWMIGEPGLGLVLGAYVQLVSSYATPGGRDAGPDVASGTIVGVVVAASFAPAVSTGRGHLALALLVALGVAALGSWSEKARREANRRLCDGAARGLREGGSGALGRAQAAGLGISALRGAATVAIGSAAGLALGRPLINLFAGMDFGAAFALIPCLGLASFILSAVRARRIELAGFGTGLAVALLMGLELGLS